MSAKPRVRDLLRLPAYFGSCPADPMAVVVAHPRKQTPPNIRPGQAGIVNSTSVLAAEGEHNPADEKDEADAHFFFAATSSAAIVFSSSWCSITGPFGTA